MALMAADEVKIFKSVLFLNEGKRGEGCLGSAREKERAAALSVGASSSIYGSHFVFFPVLPNMELQSCSLRQPS